MNPFLKSFDDLLQNILTDYSNLDSSPDITEGSIVWIKGAVLASALWGIYKYQDWLSKQIFPDTASTDNLNHYGSVFGVTRLAGENDNDYANRIISYLRDPPAGGTLLDYENWAKETPAVPAAVSETFLPSAVDTGTDLLTVTQNWMDQAVVRFTSTGALPAPLAAGTDYLVGYYTSTTIQIWTSDGSTQIDFTTQGTGVHTIIPQSTTLYHVEYAKAFGPPSVVPGQVAVVCLPDDESIVGTGGMDAVIAAVTTYIEARRPVTASLTSILAATRITTNVSITVKPITSDIVTMQSDITAYMNSLVPGDTLYLSKLSSICITDGAYDAVVSVPAVDVVPTIYQVVRPGAITITPSA